METNNNLFADFAPVRAAQWKAKIIEDLKGADYDKKLVWKTDEGFPVQPFYSTEDRPLFNLDRYTPSFPSARKWLNYIEINAADAKAANARAVKMHQQGANGFLFRIADTGPVSFDTLLEGLDLNKIEVSYSLEKPFFYFLPSWFDYLLQHNLHAPDVTGFVELDVLDKWCLTGQEPDFRTLAEWIKSTKAYPDFRRLVIRSHAFVNAGSNVTQELAFTLNKLTDYIDRLTMKGCSANDIIGNLVLHLAIGGDYFFEIAKLRAVRVLLKNILRVYDREDAEVPVLCSNSSWSKSFYDSNVNLLRNTSEAMSALLGGCDALLIVPHDAGYQSPTDFSTRIALNIANILKEESYFDKVSDPAAGSYYIENLTAALTESALKLFREVEAKGGFIEAFKEGFIQQSIATVKDKKEKELASRKRVYVGTNKYPNLQEKAVLKQNDRAVTTANGLNLLVAQRATRVFDELRSRTLAHFEKTGYIPRVYLACFGNLAMRKARATFAGEFFGTAGFDILGEFFFNDPVTAATDAAQSEAAIIVMCSSDQDYETSAAAFARTFKSLALHKTLVLAGYPEPIVQELKSAGVDTFIHIKSNAVEVLTAFQNKLVS